MKTPEVIDLDFVRRVFFPYATREADRVSRDQTKLVHYTSAEVAQSIIRNNCVWMRNATTMNDAREIDYGLECLAGAYNHSDAGNRFRALVESIWPGLSKEFEQVFNGWQPSFKQDTYLTCVSEHGGAIEDLYGRLSMWRAYGGTSGVALVLNSGVFHSTSNVLNAYSSPVLYATQAEFDDHFDELIGSMEREREAISRKFDQRQFAGLVFEVFRFAVMSTKHPGFKEEREWRVIYTPKIHPSSRLTRSVEVVRGVPQVVYKIPLEDVPESGLVGLALPGLLDKIIIGPTKYPKVTAEAFIQLLAEVGIPDPERKVVLSDIPLRVD
jgi:hypothetical protein